MMLRPLLSLSWLMMGAMGQQRIVYIENGLNWKNAQNFCRQHYTDLVTVTTEEDNDQLARSTWLGLHRDNSTSPWKWSKGNESLKFTHTWNPNNEPDHNKHCACKHNEDHGSWRSIACHHQHRFFCVDERLLLVTEKKTWEEALDHCRALSTEDQTYDLASLITADDHQYVRSKISKEAWTGLRFLAGHWVWVGGEEVQYEGLKPCPKNRHCGMLKKSDSQNYTASLCHHKREFFCYRKPTTN